MLNCQVWMMRLTAMQKSASRDGRHGASGHLRPADPDWIRSRVCILGSNPTRLVRPNLGQITLFLMLEVGGEDLAAAEGEKQGLLDLRGCGVSVACGLVGVDDAAACAGVGDGRAVAARYGAGLGLA